MKRIIGMGLALSIAFSAIATPVLARCYVDNWWGETVILDEEVPL